MSKFSMDVEVLSEGNGIGCASVSDWEYIKLASFVLRNLKDLTEARTMNIILSKLLCNISEKNLELMRHLISLDSNEALDLIIVSKDYEDFKPIIIKFLSDSIEENIEAMKE